MNTIPMNKRKNLQSAKTARKNLLYTSEDVIVLYKICPNTLSNWVKAGLKPVCTYPQRLYKGEDLNTFHKNRSAVAKVHLRYFETYCVACKRIHSLLKEPIFAKLDRRVVVVAILCPTKQTKASKFFSLKRYEALCVLRGDNPSTQTPD